MPLLFLGIYCKLNFENKMKRKIGGAKPTRKWNKIFLIGLSKTGINSISRLFNSNGIKTWTYKIGTELGKKMMDQVKFAKYGNIELIDRLDAYGDIVASSYYHQLDILYPNSLYIYMIRDMDDWLKSASRWWARTDDKRIRLAHNNGFIKTVTYGSWRFNKWQFRHIAIKHMLGVLSYFDFEFYKYGELVNYIKHNGFLLSSNKKCLIVNICNGSDKKNVKILSKFVGIEMKQKIMPYAKNTKTRTRPPLKF